MNDFDHRQPDAAEFEMQIEPAQEGGVYANFLGVWHTAYEFTLDFAVMQPPRPREGDPDSGPLVPCRIVSRIKIPPTLIFNVLQAVNENMTRYEQAFGPIRRPEEK